MRIWRRSWCRSSRRLEDRFTRHAHAREEDDPLANFSTGTGSWPESFVRPPENYLAGASEADGAGFTGPSSCRVSSFWEA